MREPGCLFCSIAAGDIPAEILERTDRVIAFADVNPQAPVHALVIPIVHVPNVAALGADGGDLLADMASVAARVGASVDQQGWRWVFNTGPRAGQTVFHVHGHVLAGRDLAWPPG